MITSVTRATHCCPGPVQPVAHDVSRYLSADNRQQSVLGAPSAGEVTALCP